MHIYPWTSILCVCVRAWIFQVTILLDKDLLRFSDIILARFKSHNVPRLQTLTRNPGVRSF